MNHFNYSKRKTACIALGIIFLMIAMFVAIEIRTEPAQTWDISVPMANAQVNWLQSFHAGAMEVGK